MAPSASAASRSGPAAAAPPSATARMISAAPSSTRAAAANTRLLQLRERSAGTSGRCPRPCFLMMPLLC